MERYKLNRDNKYSGKVDINNKKEVAKSHFKGGKIKFFSVAMVLMLSISSAYGIMDHFSKKADDVKCLSSYMSYDGEEISINILNYRSKYKEIEKIYNNMTNEEKCNYVVSVFNGVIDGCDEFTDDEKEKLKAREGKFLQEYGYNYYFENIFDMLTRLKRLKVVKEADLGIDCIGNYSLGNDTINMEYGFDVETLGHEVEHAITVEDVNMDSRYAYYYIMESMDSCTDLEYYNNDTYHDIMRSHMLFLSKIIGLDNLLKVYLNSDFKLLEELLGSEDYESLMELFDGQHKLVLDGSGMDSFYCEEIANKLKSIYEKKNNCWIEESKLMNTIYEASKLDSGISIYTSLFDEVQMYSHEVDLFCFDDDYLIDVMFVSGVNDVSVIEEDPLKNFKEIADEPIDDHICLKKLHYLFPEKVVNKIINHPKKYLKLYLEELGVSDVNYWTYNISNDMFPIFCCGEGFYYDEACFNEDLSIILKAKYQELKKNDRLSELYDDFDVFYYNENNVDDDKFREFCKEVVNYDKDLSVESIINNSSRSNHHRKR